MIGGNLLAEYSEIEYFRGRVKGDAFLDRCAT